MDKRGLSVKFRPLTGPQLPVLCCAALTLFPSTALRLQSDTCVGLSAQHSKHFVPYFKKKEQKQTSKLLQQYKKGGDSGADSLIVAVSAHVSS